MKIHLSFLILFAATTACVHATPEVPLQLEKVEKTNLYSLNSLLNIDESTKTDLNNRLYKARGLSLNSYFSILKAQFEELNNSVDKQESAKSKCEKSDFKKSDFLKKMGLKFPTFKSISVSDIHSYLAYANLRALNLCMENSYQDTLFKFVEFKYYVHTLSNDIQMFKKEKLDEKSLNFLNQISRYDLYLSNYGDDRWTGLSQQEVFFIESDKSLHFDEKLKKWILDELAHKGPYNPDTID